VFARLRHNLERRLGVKWDEIRGPAMASSLKVPGLIVHDKNDPDVPWSNGVALAESWRGSELLSTHGLGHSQVMRDPGVIDRIIAFLGETPHEASAAA
jgi:pimeloyl-ACP methyl ester carboxylesterase